MNAEQMKRADAATLLKWYNERTGKSLRKFASAEIALKRCLEELARGSGGERKVKKSAPLGRPKHSFTVIAASGKSNLHKESLRGKLISYLNDRDGRSASIEQIESKFNRNMRGVVSKMEEMDWVKVREEAEAA